MKPDSPERPRLRPEARTGPAPDWFRHHAVGLVTLLLGLAAFITVAASQQDFWSQPDWRLSVPFLVTTVVAGAISMARREGALFLPLLGIGLAAAATVLGFFVVFAAVVAVTALVILLLSGVF